MHVRSAIVCALVAAAGSTASATDFTWTGGTGAWSDPLKWTGPANQFPDSIADTATLSGATSSATIQANLSLGGLTLLNDARVHTNLNRVFVGGGIDITGNQSRLFVTNSPSAVDLDADTVTILSGSLRLLGSTVQIDETLILDSTDHSGAVVGSGVIEMDGAGDVDLRDAFIWASDDLAPGQTLLFRRTESSTSRFDWTDPETVIVASRNSHLHIAMPYRGSFTGLMGIYDESSLISDQAVVMAASSEISLGNDLTPAVGVATLDATVLDASGSWKVHTDAVIAAPFAALRDGPMQINGSANLTLDATSVILDALNVTPLNGSEGGVFYLGDDVNAVSVIGGTTIISLGDNGRVDLDGGEDATITIANGSALVIDTESIDTDDEVFNGTLNVNGTLILTNFEPDDNFNVDRWFNEGEIVLNAGDIDGRICFNDGIVRGRGSVELLFNTTGSVVAEGGTLAFDSLTFGSQPDAIVRAETGDISSAAGGAGGQDFFGEMFIGDGAGNREVIETNRSLFFATQFNTPGSLLTMNGGFLRARAIAFRSRLAVNADSTVRASGASPTDGVEFSAGSESVINALAEIDGNTTVRSDATFSGSGTFRATHTGKTATLDDGADLGSLSFQALGRVEIDGESIGEAAADELVLLPTSTLAVDLAGAGEDVSQDRLTIAGQAAVLGDIEVRWAGGDVVPLGQTYTIITAGSVTGAVDDIDFSGLGPNRRAFVDLNDDNVQVFVTCLADLDRSGNLDIGDVVKFLQSFGAQDDLANFGGGPQFDIADVVGFLNAFGLGCN
ncbi:MAG: hypothetical protein CMJ31_14770 [Phycisphaerae bacterium]|nr:hypothetical protein [Phycisphaerae bacterium]